MKTYKYTTSVTIGKDLNGKPIKKYIRADTKHELDLKKAQLLVDKGLFINSSITFEEFSKTWFKLRIANRTASYIKCTNIIMRVHILPALGFMQIANIKKINVEKIIQDLVAENKYNTAKKSLIIIKSVLELAVENELVEKNVARSIKAPKYIKTEKQALTKQQQENIINNNSKYADFFKVLLYTRFA